jgi:predicted Rdx family selenoprotein
MDYLDGAALEAAGGDPLAAIHASFRDHLAVPVALKRLGYEYVHIGSAWEPTSTNVDADRVLRWRPGSEFESALLATSAWGLSQPDIPPGDEEEETEPLDRTAFLDHLRQDTLFQFDRLEDVADRPGPTCVFAHVLMPHNPWRFNADGSFPTPEQLRSRTRDQWFIEHVQWTNERVLRLLDVLLDAPPGEEPIVILQADEGEFPRAFAYNQEHFDWLRATPDQVQHKYGILNAFHLPGVDAEAAGVHDRISPVNAFRVVFNAYFDAGLPILPDRTWLSPDWYHMYDFVEYERP